MKLKTKFAKCAVIAIVFCTAFTYSNGQGPVTDIQTDGVFNWWGSIFDPATPAFAPQALGVGNFTRPAAIPAAALDVNTNLFVNPFYGAGNVFQTDAPNIPTFWRHLRGGIQYGMLYSQPISNFVADFDFHLEATQRDFMIHTVGVSANAALAQRIRVTSGTGLGYNLGGGGGVVNLPNVTETVIERVGNLLPGQWPAMQWPRAMLNIGADIGIALQAQGGWRNWMDVGTFTIFNTDNMYMGLKIEPNLQNDRHDAVISWGDNDALQAGGGFGPDNLRFIYTTTNGIDGSPEAQPDGSEVARFTPDGLAGIGNFTPIPNGGGSGIQPARRLEIYDQSFNNNTPLPAPQLRLTRIPALANTVPLPNNILNTGTWTDFQTNNLGAIGNLYIHPSSDLAVQGTPINGRVGIHIAQPGNTLEINPIGDRFGNSVVTANPGISGLRLNDMQAQISLPTLPNPWDGAPQGHLVLTVDDHGDVILVEDEGDGTGVFACNGPEFPLLNRVTKFSTVGANPQVCNTIAFDDGSHFGVNTDIAAPGTPLNYTFQNAGSAMFTMTTDVPVSPFTYQNTYSFPLAVKTGIDVSGRFHGFAILSTASNPTFQDALHIFSDGGDNNAVHVTTIGNNTIFQDNTQNNSLLGFIPFQHVTVVKENFATNQTQGPRESTFYVEAQWNAGNALGPLVKDNAIYGNSNWDETLGNYSGFNFTGIRGESSRLRLLPNISNTGGYFEGSNALSVNTGAHLVSIGPASRTNYGAYIWTGAATEPTSAVGTSVWNYGVFSRVFYQRATGNFGGYFKAEDGASNYGIWSEATNPPPLSTPITNNFGGRFSAGNATNINYGVYATSNGFNNCNPGLCTQAAGFFAGDLYGSGTFQPSDSILKNNIVPLSSDDTLIYSLPVYSFSYKTLDYPTMNLPQGTHYGFLAQELAAKLPNAVRPFKQPAEYDTLGGIIHQEVEFLGINYSEIIPLLSNGIQHLKHELDSLKQVIAGCCSGGQRIDNENGANGLNGIQNSNVIARLDQNQPNPFNIETKIKFFIPDNTISKTLMIFDMQGTLLKQISIAEKGESFITIHASEFRAGMYMYSLLIDGKEIDSKRMILTN